MPTIRDIAKLANVSPATVSRVLNNDDSIQVTSKTKKKIFEVAEKLAYTKHRHKSPTKANKKLIGIVHWYTIEQEINDPYFISIRMGMQHECLENDLDFEIIYNDNNLKKTLASQKYHGIIILGRFCDETLDFIESLYDNIVYAHTKDMRFKYDSVHTDFRALTKDVLNYLIKKGHKKIGYIGGQEVVPVTKARHIDPRELEFQEIMYQHNQFNSKYFKVGDYSIESGYKLANDLIKMNHDNLPTAIFCGNDSIALGACRVIQEHRLKIPKDIEIFSVNDIPTLQYTSPSLSTVKIYSEFMGVMAIRLLIEQMKNERDLKLSIIVPYELVFRESA
ncbi:LacI family DNA-binding transcriptional regulator [Liberiplasma polymorphum]|uniref:LacI family DNA-binding transcriptional regulator n=1 Tax=Liberiplasma polymorphum TaxID=3374570 RepID=UPI00377604E8